MWLLHLLLFCCLAQAAVGSKVVQVLSKCGDAPAPVFCMACFLPSGCFEGCVCTLSSVQPLEKRCAGNCVLAHH